MITREQLEKGENSEDIVLLGDVSSCCHDQNSDHGNMMPFLDLPMTDRVQNIRSLPGKQSDVGQFISDLNANQFKSETCQKVKMLYFRDIN